VPKGALHPLGLPPLHAAAMVRRPNRKENKVVDIFDEVEEELREERIQQFLKKYAILLVAGCLLIVGAVAGWKTWVWYEQSRDLAAAASYMAAASKTEVAGVAGPNLDLAAAAFQTVGDNAPEGYRVLAHLREAALRAESGDPPGAPAVWDQVAADKSADPLLRDLAGLIWCLHQADKGDPTLLEARLKPLAAPGAAWRALAQEQLAVLDLRQGKTEEARAKLRTLTADPTAPSGVRGRAGAIIDRVGG
jgi:hypothetical protein